ncbi:MAG: M48 family metalloprotease, partial [Acidimicrobiales bacterium]
MHLSPKSPAAVAAADTFEMPSETLLRFVVLTTGLVFAALFLVESLYYTVHADSERLLLTRCRAVAAAVVDPSDAAARETECRAPAQRDRVVWTSAVLPLVVVVGVSVSLALPWARRRRRSLRAVPESLAVVHDRVGVLGSRLEISHIPRLWWQPRRVGGAATAFGLPGRPELEISPGTATLAITDRSRFDAIVAHELAHHRNRDIVVGAVAVGSLAAFLAAAVVPFMVGSLLSDVPVRVVLVSWLRVALVILVTALVQRAVLRSREHEADLRATAAQIDMAPAMAGLTAGKQPAVQRTRSRARVFGSGLFATHPAPVDRMAIVLYPLNSLIPSMVQCFAAGFFCMLSVPTISRLASAWLSGTASVNEGMLWVAAFFTALLGAWLAVGLRRAAALGSSRVVTTIGPGFAAGLGAVTALVAFDAPLYQQLQVFPGGWTEFLAMITLVVAITALAGWLAMVGRLADDTGLRSVSRYATPAVGAIAAAVVVAPLVRTLFFARITVQDDAPGSDKVVAFLQVLDLNIGTPTVMALMLLALTVPPLCLEVVLLRRRRSAPLTDQRLLRRFVAVPVGIVAGLLGFLAYRVHEERLDRISTREVRQSFMVAPRLVLAGELHVASGAALGALAIVLFNPRRRTGSALVAAAIAALVGAALTVAYQNSYGPNQSWTQSVETAAPIVAFALMAALTVTILQWVGVERIPALASPPLLATAVVATFALGLPLAAWVSA